MVTFELFVRPALRKMAGSRAIDRPRVWARALEAIRNPGGRRGYLRVTLARDGREYGAKLTGDQGSAILKSMVRADGLAVVAPDTIVPAGDRVEGIVLRALEPRVLVGLPRFHSPASGAADDSRPRRGVRHPCLCAP